MSGRRTELPAMPDCTGCGECCTVVKVRPDEAKRIRHHVRTNGVEWSPPEHQPEDWASRGDEGPNRYCGFLRVDGWRYRCAVYDVRPWSCRAFGVVKGMACSYFPELAVSGPAPLAAVMLRLVDPDGRYLGEYLARMAPYLEAAKRKSIERFLSLDLADRLEVF